MLPESQIRLIHRLDFVTSAYQDHENDYLVNLDSGGVVYFLNTRGGLVRMDADLPASISSRFFSRIHKIELDAAEMNIRKTFSKYGIEVTDIHDHSDFIISTSGRIDIHVSQIISPQTALFALKRLYQAQVALHDYFFKGEGRLR